MNRAPSKANVESAFYVWKYSNYHWPLYGLALNDELLEKVYRANALKILRK